MCAGIETIVSLKTTFLTGSKPLSPLCSRENLMILTSALFNVALIPGLAGDTK